MSIPLTHKTVFIGDDDDDDVGHRGLTVLGKLSWTDRYFVTEPRPSFSFAKGKKG